MYDKNLGLSPTNISKSHVSFRLRSFVQSWLNVFQEHFQTSLNSVMLFKEV